MSASPCHRARIHLLRTDGQNTAAADELAYSIKKMMGLCTYTDQGARPREPSVYKLR